MIKIDRPEAPDAPGQTVVELVRAAAKAHPEKEALVCGAVRHTWAQFDARINRVSNALLARGLEKGEPVAILSPN